MTPTPQKWLIHATIETGKGREVEGWSGLKCTLRSKYPVDGMDRAVLAKAVREAAAIVWGHLHTREKERAKGETAKRQRARQHPRHIKARTTKR